MRRLAMLLVTAMAIPVLASAQAGTRTDTTAGRGARGARAERMTQQDTTRRMRRRSHARMRRMRTAGGEVALGMGLDHSQVQQLQQALQSDGCDPGPADGVLGPRTRQAMACSRQKHDLTGRNANELFRTLNLPFTTPDSMGMGGVMRGQRRMRDTTGMMRDMGRMHGNMRGRMRDTTRPDTTH